MKKVEMLAMLRKVINDEQATGFTEGGNLEQPEGTQELYNYLDRAVDDYSRTMAGKNDVRLIQRMTVSAGKDLPSDFIDFCGNVPITVEGQKMTYRGEASSYTVRYFARLPYVTSFEDGDPLPYDNDQARKIIALAAIYALNKNEYNVAQDVQLLGLSRGTSHANATG